MLSQVGLLRPAGGSERQPKEARAAALALKLKLEEIKTPRDAKGVESAFQTAKEKHVGAIMTLLLDRLLCRKKAHRRPCRHTAFSLLTGRFHRR